MQITGGEAYGLIVIFLGIPGAISAYYNVQSKRDARENKRVLGIVGDQVRRVEKQVSPSNGTTVATTVEKIDGVLHQNKTEYTEAINTVVKQVKQSSREVRALSKKFNEHIREHQTGKDI